MRMIRDSPPELARLFAGPYASRSRTRRPERWRKLAVHEPKTPAPITIASKLFFALTKVFTLADCCVPEVTRSSYIPRGRSNQRPYNAFSYACYLHLFLGRSTS